MKFTQALVLAYIGLVAAQAKGPEPKDPKAPAPGGHSHIVRQAPPVPKGDPKGDSKDPKGHSHIVRQAAPAPTDPKSKDPKGHGHKVRRQAAPAPKGDPKDPKTKDPKGGHSHSRRQLPPLPKLPPPPPLPLPLPLPKPPVARRQVTPKSPKGRRPGVPRD